ARAGFKPLRAFDDASFGGRPWREGVAGVYVAALQAQVADARFHPGAGFGRNDLGGGKELVTWVSPAVCAGRRGGRSRNIRGSSGSAGRACDVFGDARSARKGCDHFRITGDVDKAGDRFRIKRKLGNACNVFGRNGTVGIARNFFRIAGNLGGTRGRLRIAGNPGSGGSFRLSLATPARHDCTIVTQSAPKGWG